MYKTHRLWSVLAAIIGLAMASSAAAQADATPEQLFRMAMNAYEKQQYEFARAFFDKACAGGQPGGCFNMGLMADYGVGGEEDRPQARIYYKMACDGRVGEGCFYLANMLYKGEGGPADKSGARVNFQIACDLGGVKSCFLLGDMLNRGEGGSEDKPLAQTFFMQACDEGYEIACESVVSSNNVNG